MPRLRTSAWSNLAPPLPLAARAGFDGLDYFPYDPALRVSAKVVPAPVAPRQIGSSGPDSIAAERFAEARFSLGGAALALELYWLIGYAGGLFLVTAKQKSYLQVEASLAAACLAELTETGRYQL